jgi:hypothetical protein
VARRFPRNSRYLLPTLVTIVSSYTESQPLHSELRHGTDQKGIASMRLPISLSTGPRYCPLCGSDDILRSRRREVIDFLSQLVMLRPFRCMECNRRHYGFFFIKRVSPETYPDAEGRA